MVIKNSFTDLNEIEVGFKKSELGIIPNDWEVRKIGDVGEVKMCRRIFNNQTKTFGTIPFYKIGTFGKQPDAYITEELYLQYRDKFSYPKKGDILISAAGTIGKTVVFDGAPSYFQDSNIVWIDNRSELVSNEFLNYVFKVVKYNTEGGTIQRLYNSILLNTKFALPPKSEQIAITAILKDMDALIAQTEKLIEKKVAIQQGVMKELLRPKDGWETRKFTDVVKFIHGKAHEQFIVDDGKYEVVNSKFISSNGTVKKFSNISFLTAKKGDVLTVLSDLPNGKALAKCYYVETDDKYAVNQRICIWRSNSCYPKFLYYFLNRHDYFMSLDDGVSQTHILNSHINKFYITIPDNLETQVEIGNILWDIDLELKSLEIKLQKTKNQKLGMIQALLTGKIRLV